jgi:hypothetical protein
MLACLIDAKKYDFDFLQEKNATFLRMGKSDRRMRNRRMFFA